VKSGIETPTEETKEELSKDNDKSDKKEGRKENNKLKFELDPFKNKANNVEIVPILKNGSERKTIKMPSGTTGPIMRRVIKKEEGYRYVPPVKPENEAYGKSKIKII